MKWQRKQGMKTAADQHPPKARLTFHVGVTGHRALPDGTEDALRRQTDAVLKEIKRIIETLAPEIGYLFREETAGLRVISMLAEGSDRLAADCALQNGYELMCPLPMGREEYEKDFTSDQSREDFRRYLGLAESVFEIEACTTVRSRAYQDCGNVMLGQSDLLIAIWDGMDSGKVGGTSDTVDNAIRQDIPVVWIKSTAGHEVSVIYGEKRQSDWASELEKTIRHILMPWGAKKENEAVPVNYFKESLAPRRPLQLYMRLTGFLSWSPGKSKKETQSGRDEPFDAFYLEYFFSHYSCADKLAEFYRDIYRSCGVLRQLLPFIASIGLALGFYTALFAGPAAGASASEAVTVISTIGFILQALCFLAIIVLSKIEKKRRWHQKFVDYRALSELLRQMAYLAPAGLAVRGLQAPAFGSREHYSWVNWQFRAIVRNAGLPARKIDCGCLKNSADKLKNAVIHSQMLYHTANKRKMGLMTGRLEKFGMAIYYIGIMIVVLRGGFHAFVPSATDDQSKYLSQLFNMLSMVIPLFSAVAFGISAQEGFERILRLSETMCEKLAVESGRIGSLESVDFRTYRDISQHAADLMLSEFSDWNSFIKTKPISDH
jgi:hypothetical protein